MSAGRRNCFVTVERKTGVRDADGGERVVWALVNKYWAAIEPLSATEFIAASQTQSKISGKMRFLYPADVVAADRITYDGKSYDVIGVLPSGQRREVVVIVSEGLADGR